MSEDAETLIQHAHIARQETRMDDARRDLVEAVSLCRDAGRSPQLARALQALGQVERDLGNLDEALARYQEAESIERETGDELAVAHVVRHIADVHEEAGRSEEAERCYIDAVALYRADQRTRPLELANALRPYAILRAKQGDPDLASALFREARDLYEKAGVTSGVEECEARLAHLGRR